MKILVIGQNGREHALAVTYAKSKKADMVFIAPGNGLTDFNTKKIKNVPIEMDNIDALVAFAKKEMVDLVDVAQDDCIAKGYVDRFEKENIRVFGPTQKAAQLEWDKQWSRNFMVKYNLPVPKFASFNNQNNAIAYVNSLYSHPELVSGSRSSKSEMPKRVRHDNNILLFIKASGLALGKGVIRAENRTKAIAAIKTMQQFGKSGETFLIEEGLVGEEFTLFAICDGEDYVITKSSQDHKTIYDGDKGPNTGGVGSVAPTGAVTKKLLEEIEKTIIKPTITGMKKEGRPYSGILYLGGMITANGIKIIEFNARWGDPEAEVILPSIQTDYVEIANAVTMKQLSNLTITFDNKVRISIAGCSKGYPGNYSAAKGKEIFGLEKAMELPSIQIFGSGITRKGKHFFANGGRVFHVVAEGKDIAEARKRGYETMSFISIEGDNLHYRTDIGWRDLERISK